MRPALFWTACLPAHPCVCVALQAGVLGGPRLEPSFLYAERSFPEAAPQPRSQQPVPPVAMRTRATSMTGLPPGLPPQQQQASFSMPDLAPQQQQQAMPSMPALTLLPASGLPVMADATQQAYQKRWSGVAGATVTSPSRIPLPPGASSMRGSDGPAPPATATAFLGSGQLYPAVAAASGAGWGYGGGGQGPRAGAEADLAEGRCQEASVHHDVLNQQQLQREQEQRQQQDEQRQQQDEQRQQEQEQLQQEQRQRQEQRQQLQQWEHRQQLARESAEANVAAPAAASPPPPPKAAITTRQSGLRRPLSAGRGVAEAKGGGAPGKGRSSSSSRGHRLLHETVSTLAKRRGDGRPGGAPNLACLPTPAQQPIMAPLTTYIRPSNSAPGPLGAAQLLGPGPASASEAYQRALQLRPQLEGPFNVFNVGPMYGGSSGTPAVAGGGSSGGPAAVEGGSSGAPVVTGWGPGGGGVAGEEGEEPRVVRFDHPPAHYATSSAYLPLGQPSKQQQPVAAGAAGSGAAPTSGRPPTLTTHIRLPPAPRRFEVPKDDAPWPAG